MIDVLFKAQFSLLERYLARRNFKRFSLTGKDDENDSDSSSLSHDSAPGLDCDSDEKEKFDRMKSKFRHRLESSYTG